MRFLVLTFMAGLVMSGGLLASERAWAGRRYTKSKLRAVGPALGLGKGRRPRPIDLRALRPVRARLLPGSGTEGPEGFDAPVRSPLSGWSWQEEPRPAAAFQIWNRPCWVGRQLVLPGELAFHQCATISRYARRGPFNWFFDPNALLKSR